MADSVSSLDPRINRLSIWQESEPTPKTPLDQFETYEVFFQLKEGKPFEHAGIVHAPNEDMAFLFGKEQYSRRYTCTGMWIAKTQNVFTSGISDADVSAYDLAVLTPAQDGDLESYEIFHLKKRGKQQVYVGRVYGKSYEDALYQASLNFRDQQTFQVWLIKTVHMLFSNDEDKDLWFTLPEKKYRDAIAYKSADKINAYKQRTDHIT